MCWCQLDAHECFWMISILKQFLKKHHRQINTDLWRPCPLSSLSSCLEYCSHYYLQESPKSDIVGLSWLEIGVLGVLVGILGVMVCALDVFDIGIHQNRWILGKAPNFFRKFICFGGVTVPYGKPYKDRIKTFFLMTTPTVLMVCQGSFMVFGWFPWFFKVV